MEPVRPLLCKYKYLRLVNLLTEEGMEPVRPAPLKFKNSSFLS